MPPLSQLRGSREGVTLDDFVEYPEELPSHRLLILSKEGYNGHLWATWTMGTKEECYIEAARIGVRRYQVIPQEIYQGSLCILRQGRVQ